jgi:hypothetical protein
LVRLTKADNFSVEMSQESGCRSCQSRAFCLAFGHIWASAEHGEGGIRTLGALLGHGALAKLCFQPLSHLTKSSGGEYGEELLIANTDLRRVLAISSELLILDCQSK